MSNDSFVLGEINATTKATQKDVAEMRTELGDVARRVTALENWKSNVEGKAKGGLMAIKPVWAIAMVLLGSAATIAGRAILGI